MGRAVFAVIGINPCGMITVLLSQMPNRPGFWKLPDGEAAYAYALRQNTTTDRTAIEIHRTGLGEVFRILTEMDGILD